MRTIANIPATVAVTNDSDTTVVLGSVISITIPAGESTIITKANYPVRNVPTGALEVIEEIWLGIVALEAKGVLSFDDGTTVDAGDVEDWDKTATDTVQGLRPGMPGYFPNEGPASMEGSFVAATKIFTVAWSKPVNKANGTAIAAGDFAVTFAANGGNATAAAIVSATAVGGGALDVNAMAAVVTVSVTGTPSGQETVTLSIPGSRDAGDANGQNKLPVGGTVVGTFANVVPAMSGSYSNTTLVFTVAYDEAISKANGLPLTLADFAIVFAANAGTATGATLVSATAIGGGVLAANAHAASVTISVTGVSSGTETVTLTTPGGRDGSGAALTGSIVGTLINVAPALTGAFDPATLVFTVAFDQRVNRSNTGPTAIRKEEFTLVFAANGGDATAAAIVSATAVGGGALATNASAAEVTISVTGTATGEETVTLTAPGALDPGGAAATGSIVGTLDAA